MQAILNNLLNGNLTAAQNGARRVSGREIAEWTEQNLDYDSQRSRATALYLKDQIDFKTYCAAIGDTIYK